jgi:hypothetical protein
MSRAKTVLSWLKWVAAVLGIIKIEGTKLILEY